MTHLNFKFLVVCLVVVASVVGLQAQNDVPIRGEGEIVPAGVWNDVNGEYINAHVILLPIYVIGNMRGCPCLYRRKLAMK